MRENQRVRTIYLVTTLVALGLAGGFALAAVLTTTTVNQSANAYQGGNSGANGYTTATLSVSTVPAAISVCTSGTKTGATSAGTVTLVLSSTSGGTVCTTGDFAEEYAFSFSATITTQTNTITITTQVGAGTVATNSEAVTLGTGSSGAFTQTVDVFVDYGSVSPPGGGVTVLDAVIQ
ncbi:MAG: hypothetical protein L3K01_01710 [Thermoplasmata archaeon]|nr:hypothetical protein [Thermoplasmata archaeon]MCI4332437.1 hypothetical protein [Thermoplasmata archaeon]